MNRKLGLNADCLSGVDQRHTLELIADTGFQSYFTTTCKKDLFWPIKQKGDALGLTCEFLHAPTDGVNTMWSAGDSYQKIDSAMREAIDTAADCEVPAVILHISSGWNAPRIHDIGLARFDALVEYAANRGVRILFENLRMIGNVAYFTDHYRNAENVGFCLDCGHEHCFTKTVSWLDIFRERTAATHIHDNFGGTDPNQPADLHLLPFDGTYDYAAMMKKLDRYGYEGVLMLEVYNTSLPSYRQLSETAFVKTAFDRITEISKM